MERRGTVPFRTRPLIGFIGEAITARSEVLSVLHLLDKPDEVWDDPAMDRIYDDLRAEFDLADRYSALELKLRSVQESLNCWSRWRAIGACSCLSWRWSS